MMDLSNINDFALSSDEVYSPSSSDGESFVSTTAGLKKIIDLVAGDVIVADPIADDVPFADTKIFTVIKDDSRDALLTDFGKETLTDRYLLPGESYQDLFVRVASAYADNGAHAQRLYDYISKLWFMPSTPILSNGGSKRGLPISCFLNSVPDSLAGIVDTWTENVWLASRGGGIGCVDADTEFLTPLGWKRIADYQEGDEVFTVTDSTSCGHFALPERYIAAPVTKMYQFTGQNLDMVVSEDHRNYVLWSGKGGFGEVTTDKLLKDDSYKNARFKPAVWSAGRDGLPYAELELRFMVAVAADSTNNRDDLGGVRFRFTRLRKIERMRWMLNELGIDYVEAMEGHSTAFRIYDQGLTKLPLDFAHFGNASRDQLRIIYDEIGHWDGSFDPRTGNVRFSTMKKNEADFAQYVIMASTGMRAGLGMKTRDGEWVARKTNDVTAMVKTVEEFIPEDGKQYCFQTSTTYWLARRNGAIFVTGNTYWGNVRGIGEPVGLNGKTSGIIPFVRVMDSLTLAISQGSLRRGSAACYIDVHHPEIEEFLEIRKPSGDFNRKALNIHHGILLTNAFMEAVRSGSSFDLVSPKDGSKQKEVDARSLFQKIVETRLATGEPYIVFADHVNDAMPAFQKKAGLKVSTSNLCSEITLPTGKDHHGIDRTAVCCLSSLNLETWDQWNKDPQFIEDVMRFLDNVIQDYIERAEPSMKNARYAAMRERSVGLGVMGFHSFLQQRGLPFEGAMAKSWNMRFFKHIRGQVDVASQVIAEERGACPDAAEYGVMERFACKMAIAPTASISIICGGASACIEPIPANIYTHKTLSGSFSVKNPYLEKIFDAKGVNTDATWNSILEQGGSVQHLDFLSVDEKDCYKTSFEIDQRWLLELAGDRTPYIDQAQSLNLYIPADTDKWNLLMLHFRAWEMGIKSLYYLRSKSLQRAGFAGAVDADNTLEAPHLELKVTNFDECLSCQ